LLETGEELCWMIVSLFSLLEKVAVIVLQVQYRVCTGKALPELAARELASKSGLCRVFASLSDHTA
jgi:hypothetical protein